MKNNIIYIKNNIISRSITIPRTFRTVNEANDFADVFLFHKRWGDRMHNSQKIKRDLDSVGRLLASISILAIITHIFLF